MEQPNYYSIMPATVRYDKKLKANEKLLFSEITALANKQGYCHANNSYFAELYDVDKSTISRWINHLSKRGYLQIKTVYKGKQIVGRKLYPNSNPIDQKVNTYGSKDEEGIDKKIKTPIDQKVKDNNTSINTTRKNNTSMNNIQTTNHSQSSMAQHAQNSGGLSDKQKISQYWQRELRTVTNGMIESKLGEWVDEFGYDMVKYYLDYALLKQIDRSRMINYLSKIFDKCRKDGIHTLQDAKQAEQEHQNKVKQRFSTRDTQSTNKPRYKFATRDLPEGMTQSEAIAKELAEVEAEEGAS